MRIAFIIIPGVFSLLFILSSAYAQVRLPGGMDLPRGGGGGGGGAILDDSTKNIYGPKTTLHFFENDIYNNRDSVRYLVDTSMTNFFRWSPVARSWGTLIDLGNVATASHDLFFRPRIQIGTQLGMRAYEAYAIKADEVEYYDTHSPNTVLSFNSGPKKTNIGTFGYTQNIHSRLNFGLKVQRLTSTKQYGTYSSISNEALLGQNWTFLFQSSYFSKNKKYLMLAHYRHLNQKVREQGGVIPDIEDGVANPYSYNGQARLNDDANSWERRQAVHLYQQYKLANGFQVFQQAEYESIINRYTDKVGRESDLKGVETGLYKTIRFDSSESRQDIFYKLFENKIGIKGKLSGFNYRAYLRNRFYGMRQEAQVASTEGIPYERYRTGLKFDNIVGAWLGYYLKDSVQYLTAESELNLSANFEYLLRGELHTKWGIAGAQFIQTAPDLIMNRYSGNNFIWNNDFQTAKTISFNASLPIKTDKFSFIPEAQLYQNFNYIYYNQEAKPVQFNDALGFRVYRAGATYKTNFKHFNLEGRSFVSWTDNQSVLKIPLLFTSGQITFDFVYSQELYIQLGLAARYNTNYYANAYMPVTQQFYIQNTQELKGRIVTDAFANLRIKRVRLFLEMSYLNMGKKGRIFPKGYYVTPAYLGLPRAFSFGFSWPLFD